MPQKIPLFFVIYWGHSLLHKLWSLLCWVFNNHALDVQSYLFFSRYKREFGFIIENREIIVDDIRVRGIGKSVIEEEETIAQCEGNPASEVVSTVPK